MNLQEARLIGKSKLKINDELFGRCYEVGKKMGVIPAHRGPMTLALAILGVSEAHKAEDMAGELTDALALVSKAENEWRMMMRTQELH